MFTHLQMTLGVEKEILRFDIAMCDALTVEIRNTRKHLLEAALDFTGRHTTLLDRSVEISTRAKFHNLAPVLVLVLNEIYCLNYVDMVQRGGNTKLCGEFLDVLLF
jgi:hypothetical protein